MVKTVFALTFILIVSVLIPRHTFAAEKASSKPASTSFGGFYITPTAGGYFFAKSEQRNTVQSYGLKIGYDKLGKSIADNLGVECSANYFTTKSKVDASKATGYLFRLDANYPFVIGTKWMPFLSVGAGGIVVDSVSHGDTSPLVNYGAGLKYFVEDYLALRIDTRHLLIYKDVSTRNNFEVGVGMNFYFGKDDIKKVSPAITRQEDKEIPPIKKITETELQAPR